MLYQKGTQRIEVIIRKDMADSGAQIKDADDSITDENIDSKGKKSASKRRRKRIIVTNVTHSLATIRQITGLSIQYYISGIGVRNGDQAMQDQVNRTVEKVTDVTNLASNVARGAVFGAWGGFIGVAVGMTTAAAASGASLAVKYAGREREYDYKVFKENNAIEYNRTRAGINILNGRLR